MLILSESLERELECVAFSVHLKIEPEKINYCGSLKKRAEINLFFGSLRKRRGIIKIFQFAFEANLNILFFSLLWKWTGTY